MRPADRELRGGLFYAPKGYKPPVDRRVPVRQVACPTCKAGVGENCFREDGSPRAQGSSHVSRRRMALRAGL